MNDKGVSGRRVTLASIARRAGVSVGTVSKVLNDRAGVSEATRRRVRALLTAYGYRRSTLDAQPVNNFIDVLMIDMDDAWAGRVLTSLESVARTAGLGIAPSVIRHQTVTDEWVDLALSRGSAGVISVFADLESSQYRRLAAAGIGCVTIGQGSPVPAGCGAVAIDFRSGARLACQHLLSRGHERIGLIVGPRQLIFNRDRYLGYRDAYHDAGARRVEKLVRWSTGFSREVGRRETRLLLDTGVRPTAVIAASDTMAMGVYDELEDRGLTVGTDIAVVGFDDRPEASWLRPRLTTVALPLDRIADRAIALLLGDRPADPDPIVGDLIVRDSG